MAARKGAPVPAAVIGHRFVRQYYSLLDKDPSKLYRLYKAHSVFSHGSDDKGMTSAVGPSEIHSEFMTLVSPLERHACEVELTGVECQESRQGGVLVLVTGFLTLASAGERRHFTQALFLEKQTVPYEGYYVLNDILRYLPSQAAPKVLPPTPALPPTAAPLVSAYEPPVEAVVDAGHAAGLSNDNGYQEESYAEPEAADEAEIEDEEEAANEEDVPAEEPAPQDNQPKTWADMATKLRQGAPLAAKPRSGFSLPAAPKASMPVLPPPTAAAKAEAARAVAQTGGLPAPAASSPSTSVRLWLSRLPTDKPVQDILDCLNAALDSSEDRAIEIDRKDPSQDSGCLIVSSQAAADALVKLSKQRKLLYQGHGLKAEEQAPDGRESGRRDRRGPKGGKGSRGGGEDGEKDGRSGGSWNGNTGNGASEWEPKGARKGGKGGKGKNKGGGEGGEGGKGGWRNGGGKGRPQTAAAS